MVKRKTIMDVAKLAGVSTATVSRVLKQPDLVSEETRELVQAAIRKTAYIPNTQARNLRTRRSGLVVLVVRDIANPFYLEIFSGVEAAAHARGFAVLMGNTQNDAAREQYYFDMLRAHSADGMILMTGKLPDNDWDAYKQLPLVVALEYIPGLDVPCVRIDNERAAQTAVEHLIGLGH